MPFVPLTPDEKKQWPEPCRSREHFPPNMMVFRERMKWVCPECGHVTFVGPSRATWDVGNMVCTKGDE
jgi:hypothetical protein